ncbi:Stealth CR1 domain-containing protein [Yersinia bercovieri]|uniref:Stealth CR1 domain-containing protein n=1 Tax=Yersinia bercovieri TaxID=634 RepID=UPI00119E2511|nr:Stealth CR1 domain-containing protein [Yersinia bercovieri]
MKKLKKFLQSPGVFFRDHLNIKFPIFRYEILCPELEDNFLIRHDLSLEKLTNVNFPIDVVFTWVDDSDPAWQKRYQQNKNIVDKDTLGQHATDSARFSNHDELRYSIKSVELYLPWVRQIYIITDKQRPAWLQCNSRVTIIDHSDIIESQYLPTFNSHVIEAHLHKIPGLAEHFIYFNDDVFVARPLPPGHFFKGNGIASLFLSQKSLADMQAKGTNTPTLSASHNVIDIFEKDFQIAIDTPLVHTYVPLRKSIFEQSHQRYEREIKKFLPNKFRTNHDMNLATFFVPWLSYIQGAAVPARDICYYFNIRSTAARSSFKALKVAKKEGCLPHSFCANDFNTQKAPLEDYKSLLISALKYNFESEK